MKFPGFARRFAFILLLLGAIGAQGGAQASAPTCAGRAACAETTTLVASVTAFRTSSQPRLRQIATTVRIENKTDRPLILGYVRSSGIATDEHGNRYEVYGTNSVRGIGEISGNRFDSKFTIPAGEAADARFELVWRPAAGKIYGSQFTLDLAIREIDPVANNQFRMGAEHALLFKNLVDGFSQQVLETRTGNAPAAPSQSDGSAASSVAGSVIAQADPCEGKPRCYHAGAFYAEIAQITSARTGTYNDHVIRLNVRFRNASQAPLVMGYTAKSSVLIDNLGNRYYWGRSGTYDTSVTGMGVVTSGKADTSFRLAPGESRTASFQLVRYRPGNNPLGTSFTWDVAVEELEALSSEQVRTVRQFAMHFENLSAGAGAESVGEAVDKLKGLFGGRKK